MAILKIRDEAGNVFEVPAIKGKSAYQYAQDGGYTGTEAEFAAKLAEENPTQEEFSNLSDTVNDLPQANWLQMNSNEKDYVKNKTHYSILNIGNLVMMKINMSLQDGACVFDDEAKITSGAYYHTNVSFYDGDSVVYNKEEKVMAIDFKEDNVTCGVLIDAEKFTVIMTYDEYVEVLGGKWFFFSKAEEITMFNFTVHDTEETVQPLHEKYIPSNIPKLYAAKIGQTIVVKSIDENDKPTEWECVDISSILTNYYLKTEADALHSEIEDYVDTQVAALVNSAPETLDTLGELATAFNDNKEVVETLDKAITTKANQSDLTALSNTVASHTTVINTIKEETWTFTLDDGSTVTKKVAILS